MKATLSFNDIDTAKQFASYWACNTLTGHDMSAVKPDGSVNVIVYNVTDEKKQLIDRFIASTADKPSPNAEHWARLRRDYPAIEPTN